MSTDIAVRQPQQLSGEQIKFIADTDLIPKAYKGNVPAIYACVLTGRSLGLDDMHALRAINVIEGKATMSAELMNTLARRAGHSIKGEFSPESVTVRGKRGDNGDEMTVTWTMEMARQAGLANKDNYKKYPAAMLWARALTQLCRMLFPDVVLGVSYTPEEIESHADDGQDEDVGVVLKATENLSAPRDGGPDDEPVVAEPDSKPSNPAKLFADGPENYWEGKARRFEDRG